MNLVGKVVIITGASKGLGAELSKLFAKEGAKLVIGSRNEAGLKQVAEATGAVVLKVNVANENDVNALGKLAVKTFGAIDIWINNAGVRIPHNVIEENDMSRVRDMFETNVFGTMNGARTALKEMKKQKSGVLINVLSTAALAGRANLAAYAASKFALVGFTQAIRAEAAPFNIKVMAVFPGGMQTHFFDEEMPADFDKYMPPSIVAEKIIENVKLEIPQDEITIKRTS